MPFNGNLFIVLEGLDGSGKSSIAKRLCEILGGFYYHTPCGYYERIKEEVDKNLDFIEHFLFYLAAVRYASQDIRKLLEIKTVVCDRYIFSTLAYHRVLGIELNVDIDQLQLTVPDYTFYLDISFNVQKRRLRKRGKTFADKQMAKKDIFEKLNCEFKKYPICVICASRDEDEIVRDIVDVIKKEK